MVVGDLLGNVKRREAADAGELVTEIFVKRAEPARQLHDYLAAALERRHTIIDVFHVGRLDKGMGEVLVGRVEWMIDLEGAAAFAECAGDFDVALKKAGPTRRT